MRALGLGQFYGSRSRELAGEGFTVALMRPDPVRDVELHVHDTAHLIIHLEGTYLSSAAGAPRAGRHPLVVVNPPGTTHRDCYAREDGTVRGRFVSIGIRTDRWAEWRAAAATDAWCREDAPVMAAVARLLHTLRAAPADDMEERIVELIATASPGESRERHVPAWVGRAVELLRDRCTEPLRLSEVAATCGVHPVSLTRAFRRHLGATPGDVLRAARLDRAAGLLACTSHSISDIAHRCGYAHQSHLHRHFRAVQGVTPAAWRRGHAA